MMRLKKNVEKLAGKQLLGFFTDTALAHTFHRVGDHLPKKKLVQKRFVVQ